MIQNQNLNLEQLGFRFASAGSHTARTIMVPELEMLISAVNEPKASFQDYASAILNNNCLLKHSASNRERTLHNLRILYGLDDGIPLFKLLKILWRKDPDSLPQLAFLYAFTRDEILRELSPWMIAHPEGSQVFRENLEQQIKQRFPDRFSDNTLISTSQNLNASWAQAGYTKGRISKTRIKLIAKPASVVYALLLSYFCGIRGYCMFESDFILLLDSKMDELFSLAEKASRKGWIRLKRIGDVVDVSFKSILEESEVNFVQN